MKLQNTIKGTRPDVHFKRLDAPSPEVAVYLDGYKYHASPSSTTGSPTTPRSAPGCAPTTTWSSSSPGTTSTSWAQRGPDAGLWDARTRGQRPAERPATLLPADRCPDARPGRPERGTSGPTRSTSCCAFLADPDLDLWQRRAEATLAGPARSRPREKTRRRDSGGDRASGSSPRCAASRCPRRRPGRITLFRARRRRRLPGHARSSTAAGGTADLVGAHRDRRPSASRWTRRHTSSAGRPGCDWGNLLQFLADGGGDAGQLALSTIDAFDPASMAVSRGHRLHARRSGRCRSTRRRATWLGVTTGAGAGSSRSSVADDSPLARGAAVPEPATRAPWNCSLTSTWPRAGAPAPEVGYELGDQGWQAELAWPDRRSRGRARRHRRTTRRRADRDRAYADGRLGGPHRRGTGRPTSWRHRSQRRTGENVDERRATLRMLDRADKEVMKLSRADKGAVYDFLHKFRQNPDNPGLRPQAAQGRHPAVVGAGQRGLPGAAAAHRRAGLPPRRGQAPQGRLRGPGPVRVPDQPGHRRHRVRRPGAGRGQHRRPARCRRTRRRTGRAAPSQPGRCSTRYTDAAAARPRRGRAAAALDPRTDHRGPSCCSWSTCAPQLTAEVLLALLRRHARTTRSSSRSPTRSRADEPVDPEDFAAALERPATQVTTDDDALQAVLDERFERWQVFLHPTQRKLVERQYNGPARVGGGPGTGKTIVALHRVEAPRRSSCRPARTSRSCSPPSTGTSRPTCAPDCSPSAGPELVARVDIVNIDQLASRRRGRGKRRPGTQAGHRRQPGARSEWDDFLHRDSASAAGTPEFLADEWAQVDPRPGPSTPAPTTSRPAAPAGAAPSPAPSATRSGSSSSSSPPGSTAGRLDLAPGRRAGRPAGDGPRRRSARRHGRDRRQDHPPRRRHATATATGTSSSTRPRTSAPRTGRCCAPWSLRTRTTCSSPATPTSASTTTTSRWAASASTSAAGRPG